MPLAGGLDTLGIVVTADCNIRCTYCFQDRKQPAHMRWSTMSAALDLLPRSPRRLVPVSFLGGEPLLGFALISRAVARVNRRQGPRRRVQFALTTNGLLLTERRVAFLERHRFSVQISCDGAGPSQDLRAPGSSAILDRLFDRLRLRHRRFFHRRVSVAITMTPPAIANAADAFEYLLAKGVREVAISAAMGQRRLSLAQAVELDRQFGRIYRSSLRHYRATGEVPLVLFRRTALDPRKPDDTDWPCAAADGNNLVVDVNGEVYPCALLIRSCQRVARPPLDRRLAAMSLGPVTDLEGLQRRRARLPYAAVAAGIFGPQSGKRSSSGRCAACRHASVCFICPIACAKNPDSADSNRIPDFQCTFNQVALEYRRRFPVQH